MFHRLPWMSANHTIGLNSCLRQRYQSWFHVFRLVLIARAAKDKSQGACVWIFGKHKTKNTKKPPKIFSEEGPCSLLIRNHEWFTDLNTIVVSQIELVLSIGRIDFFI